MAESNVESELCRAIRDGDFPKVNNLLPGTSIRTLNSLESNGHTCLHVASSCGHKEIVRLLLDHGASRRIEDRDGRTPLEVAKTKEVAEMFARLEEDAVKRYSVDPREQPKWLFGQDKAEAFSRAIQWDCIKDRGVKKTVKEIEDAKINGKKLIDNNDQSKEVQSLRYYLNEAREKNDPSLLLKVYTIDSPFYGELNGYMATGNSKQVYEKICGKWSGYYTGAIMKNPALDKYRCSGVTYRGMKIDREALEQYKRGVVLTNKAFQSTSKLVTVALRFARLEERILGKVSVLIQYTILDRKSAFDIRDLSEFPEEEEVLMVPGSLFKVDCVDNRIEPYQIHLRQLTWDHE